MGKSLVTLHLWVGPPHGRWTSERFKVVARYSDAVRSRHLPSFRLGSAARRITDIRGLPCACSHRIASWFRHGMPGNAGIGHSLVMERMVCVELTFQCADDHWRSKFHKSQGGIETKLSKWEDVKLPFTRALHYYFRNLTGVCGRLSTTQLSDVAAHIPVSWAASSTKP